jgi:aminoglycoside phosphotransferase (APT) family kinase protein
VTAIMHTTDTTQFLGELVDSLTAVFAPASEVMLHDVNRRAEGASWETYVLTARWLTTNGTEVERAFAVKRQPVAGIVGDYDVEREVRLLQTAGELGCPVPGVVAHRLGYGSSRGFFVMEYVAGSIPLPDSVTTMLPRREDRHALGLEVARAMAQLHSRDGAELDLGFLGEAPSGADTGRAESSRWRVAYEDVAAVRIPVLDLALAWLDARADDVSGRAALVHNDLRVGNLVVRDGRLAAVLDWETAHVSDPVADIAWFDQRTFRGRSESACRLIPMPDFLDEYERHAGWRPSSAALSWWAVQSLVKTAIGCLQALAVFRSGERRDVRYANMAHSMYYSLDWLGRGLADGEWGR